MIPLDRLLLETDTYPLPGRTTEPRDVARSARPSPAADRRSHLRRQLSRRSSASAASCRRRVHCGRLRAYWS